eukprot:gene5057-7059_t
MEDDDDDDDDEPMGMNMGNEGSGFKEVEIREQDRYLPIANIARIMKKVLPGNAKVAKDAKESIQECVSEFISFITSEASDKCQQEKRKTINGDDLLWAMSSLGFDKYIEPLKAYLTKYRESVKGEKPEKKSMPKKIEYGMSSQAQPKLPMNPNMQQIPVNLSMNMSMPSSIGGGINMNKSKLSSIQQAFPSSIQSQDKMVTIKNENTLIAPAKTSADEATTNNNFSTIPSPNSSNQDTITSTTVFNMKEG